MFCTNCGSQLPDGGAKFCPNCGVRIMEPPAEEPCAVPEAEDAVITDAEPVQEPVIDNAAEPEPVAAVVTEEAAVPDAGEEPAAPEPEATTEETACPARDEAPAVEPEPVSEPSAPKEAAPAASEKPAGKGFHFTATVSLILTALTFLFGSIALLGLLVSMHPGIVIFMSILVILLTPLCFGFGVASFIIGLKNKRPAVWIIGLIAAGFALISFCFGIIYLIAGVFVAAA